MSSPAQTPAKSSATTVVSPQADIALEIIEKPITKTPSIRPTVDVSALVTTVLNASKVTGQLNSIVAVVNYICNIVEEAAKKMPMSSAGKLSLALSSASTILNYLNSNGLIDAQLYNTVQALIDDQAGLTALVNDTVQLWNELSPAAKGCWASIKSCLGCK